MIPRTAPRLQRLLYLGFALPPGLAALHPELNPAGQALETQMMSELRRHFEVRSAGVLPLEPPRSEPADQATGSAHDLWLTEKPPELLHRARSLARLKARYQQWRAGGWEPDVVLVYNLTPIYNQFVRWLRRQPKRPRVVLLFLDSARLGARESRWKRFRRRNLD